jgi:DNA-binding transcriptional LysR family regulator
MCPAHDKIVASSQLTLAPRHNDMNNFSDLNDINAFLLAARTGSLTAAAAELAQPTSTVSRAITRLEKDLGVLLIRRGTRGLTLTEEGHAFLPSCKRAMRSLQEGGLELQASRSSPAGLVRISCPVTFARDILGPLQGAFLKQYPEIRLEIDPYSSQFDQEPREGIDIHFKVRAPRDSQRHVRAFPGTARALFATAQYLAEQGTPTTPDDLAHHSIIGAGNFRITRTIKNKPSQTVAPPVNFRVRTNDPYVQLAFVQQNLGIAALPVYMAKWPENRDQNGGSFVPVLPTWKPDPLVLCALFTGNSRLTPKVHVLLEFLDQYIGTPRDPRLHQQKPKGDFTERNLVPASSI